MSKTQTQDTAIDSGIILLMLTGRSKTRREGLSRFTLRASETARLHHCKSGKIAFYPYPTSYSRPAVGINPTSQGFLSVFRQRQEMQFSR